MVTKLGSMVTYIKFLPYVKLHDALVIWSCNIRRETKTIIYITLYNYNITTLYNIIYYIYKINNNIIYIHHNTYGHQDWQGGDIQLRASTQKVT